MEDISLGERVREFKVEGKTDKGWITLANGSCIGHKFIVIIDDAAVSSVRLTITKQADEPVIKNFAVFHVSN